MNTDLEITGKIITFYSYKGGIGCTMAVANVGRLLARRYIKPDTEILLIDWDLDAPDLHNYFLEQETARPGLIDYFQDLLDRLRSDATFSRSLESLGGKRRAALLLQELPLEKYLVNTDATGLLLMSAGAVNGIARRRYQKMVKAFDGSELFQRFPFAIRAFREMLASRYAYVIIDSRAGVADVNGLCTSILPDKLVAMFGPNKQSESVLEIIETAVEFRRISDDQRPLSVFPLPSRFDPADLPGLQVSLKSFRDNFQRLFVKAYNLKECDLSEYFRQIILLYVPHYSYGTRIAVDSDEPDYPGSLNRGYEDFARFLGL